MEKKFSLENRLIEISDLKYKDYVAKLIPNIDKEKIIGVSMPKLRELVMSMKKEETDLFTKALPHKFHEENLLHSIIISEERDYENTLRLLEDFLPYIDNWAVCDCLKPKSFRKNKDKTIEHIKRWIREEETYTIRFAIISLIYFYLDEESFSREHIQLVTSVKSDEYYVNMAIAWYMATGLTFFYEDFLASIKTLDRTTFVRRMSIQKAVESYRIPEDKKAFLRSLR